MPERAELRELLIARPEVRRVFDALKSDRWDANEVVAVPELAIVAQVREGLARKVLRVLEDYGHGVLILGRRSHPTRFVREAPQAKKRFRSVLPTFKFAARSSSPISRVAVTKVGDAKSSSVTEWTVKLPRRQHARLLLPTDMTSIEIATLRKFLDAFEAQLPA